MWICKNCGELYSDDFIDNWDRQHNKHYAYWKSPDDCDAPVCPDCGEKLLEAHCCPICGETIITEDEEVCKDCEKFVRFAQKVYQKYEGELYYTHIKAYANGNESALTYMRDLYDEGLL